MNVITQRRLSRRDWIARSAATALALGLWPGCARFGDSGHGEDFTFIQMNDAHFSSPKCPEFFERVTSSMRAHTPRPELCLVVGDLAEDGTPAELGPMRDVLRGLGIPYHAVIGNHDYGRDASRTTWDELFPKSLNYRFAHRGWQFIGLDSSEGVKYENTRIQPSTLSWMDEQVPKLNRRQPTIIFTHFPLGPDVRYRPQNADALLERFRDVNLVAVFNGHFHSQTERQVGQAIFTTNKCCAIARGNHDKTTEKGYYLCRTRQGRIERQFVEVKPG